jgi:ATP-binding cassette subfamily B protein
MQKFKQLLKNAARLNKLVWKYAKGLMLWTLVLSGIAAAVPYASSGINALLINYLTTNFGKGVVDQTLLLLALASAILLFIPDIVASIRGYVDKRIWIDLSLIFQLNYFKKKGEIDIQSYEDPKFQDVLNKAEDRSIYPLVNFNEVQFQSMGSLTSVAIGLGVLLFYDWRICLLVILAIVPQFLIEIKYNNDTWTIWDLDAKERRRYTNLLDHFSQKNWFIELKLFQNIKLFFNKVEEILTGFRNKQKKIEVKKLFFEISGAVISGGVIGAITFWIIIQVVYGRTEIGTMIFIITSITQLQSSLITFLGRVARMHENSLYITDIFKVLDTPPVLPRPVNPTHLDGTTPEIIFENVSFSYPQSEKLTLQNISLTIHRGEKFALVGENGAGKTTFVKLLCRIYDPVQGRILIDGKDLKDIDLESWYKTLGILFQEYAPYKFEVKETISFGRSDEALDMDRIKKAAEASESDSFIQQWPEKYDQMLGTEFEKGLDPSKGQQQRLAIARLMHRKAGVMILDEPTASIDAEAEKKIFEQIEQEAKDQTVILISHKFSTVRSADRICVFKDNHIHEIGTHEELMQKDGTYAKLFREQAEGYAQ